MQIQVLQTPPLGANCYLVSVGKALGIIDPGGAADSIIRCIEEQKYVPEAIILTHGHFDHAGAAGTLAAHFNIPIFVHAKDAPMLENAKTSHAARFGFTFEGCTPDRLLEDGDTIEIGAMALKVLHTPGHTEGSICLYTEDTLFSGDMLFRGTVGIFDRENKAKMQSSMRRLMALAPETRVFPGHEGDTTIGNEQHANPFACFDWEWE